MFFAQKNPETLDLLGPIESFHDMHWHQEKGWTSTISEAQYVSIKIGSYFINKCTTSQQCSCNSTNYIVCRLLKFSE